MNKILMTLFFCIGLVANPVVITPKIHRFGTITDAQTVTAKFTLTNTSSKTMEIKEVKTFCGCTFTEPNNRLVEPNKSTELVVNFNPKGKKDYLEWEVHVFTNLQQNPLLLKFDATVLRDHHLSDDILSFGEFRKGKEVEKTIWFSPRNFPNFAVKEVKLSIDNKDLKKFFIMTSGYGEYNRLYPGKRRGFWVKVKASKNVPFGKAMGNLEYVTNVPGKEYISIPFFAKMAGDLSLSRDNISMGPLRKGKKSTRNLMVYPTEENERVVVTSVKTSLPFIKATIHPIIENQYYEIKFVSQVSGNQKRGEFRGTAIIYTSNKNQPQIRIPIQGFIR